MKNIFSAIAAVFIFCCTSCIAQQQQRNIPFAGIIIHLPDSTEAAGIIATPDGYTASFGKFDLQARMQTTGTATEKEYLAKAATQVRNWTPVEINEVWSSLHIIDSTLKALGIKLTLPATINIIRSNCGEEFGAEGYTRGNSIFLNNTQPTLGTGIVAHELFHVWSRFNKETRDKLYATIGFMPCTPINVNTALSGRGVTNPDCPVIEHFVTIDMKGKPKEYVLLLYSKKEYAGSKDVFSDMSVGLLQVEGQGKEKQAVMTGCPAACKPLIEELGAAPGLFDKVGRNTGYLIHPEEICAEHFSSLIQGRKAVEPQYIEKMRDILQGKN